jgi:soluble lytic murein transglycosylase-like protein
MHGTLAPSTNSLFSKPPPIFPCRPFSNVKKLSSSLQRKSCTFVAADPIAWLRSFRTIARVVAAIAPLMCQITASTVFQSSALAQTTSRSEALDRFTKFIAEASDRFAVPAGWVRAVMQVESEGDERAISSRGAMGLMQLMPGTWVELSARYGLGLDPFDPRDNILAGAAYLKEMHDRFGSRGFLAAYHAGPARYEHHLTTGHPLPPETIAYIALVTPLLDDARDEYAAFRIKHTIPWWEAPLFIKRTKAR